MALYCLQHNDYAHDVGENTDDDEKDLIFNEEDGHPGQAQERQDIAQMVGAAGCHGTGGNTPGGGYRSRGGRPAFTNTSSDK